MQGGFSIREYASRMRSINVVNCWPFDETYSEETVKSLLPTITVKKFTWWLDELEYMHPESAKKSEKKKKNKLEKGETSSRNEDRNMDASEIEGMGVLTVKSLKGKLKAPKKRSIVEIFAVAPAVERVISEEEEEEGSVEEDTSIREGTKKKKKIMKKKKKNTDVILRKTLRVVKKIKKKKAQKQEDEINQSVPNKENYFKFKLQDQDKATGNSSSSHSKDLEYDNRDCAPILKRKPSLQHQDAYKEKTVPCEAYELIEENQHPGFPVRGILKNHGDAFPLKQSMKCILQEAVQVNHCSTKMANKHVTFLEKDEILRLSRKPSHSMEYYEFQKVSGSDMDNVNNAEGAGKDSTMETSVSEDGYIRIGKEVGGGPASNEQLTACVVDPTAFTKRNNEKHSRIPEASKRSSLHHKIQDWCDSGLSDTLHNPMDVCPQFFRMPLDGYYNSSNIKVIGNSSNSNCRRPGPVSPLRFEEYQRTYNEPSVSRLFNMEKRKQTFSESTAMNNAHSFQFQSFPPLLPNELMNTFCSLPDGSQIGNIHGRRRINEDFVGLPLNSQGELITLNSSAKRDVSQTTNSSASAAHSINLSLPRNAVLNCAGHQPEFGSLGCRTSSMNQLNLFPAESYVKENPVAVNPSRLGIIESQSERNTNLDMDFLEINYDHSFHDSENITWKRDNQVHRSPESEKIQSTMRLMGKEFTVGGSGVQRFEDGRIWKDKQIIDELHFGNNSTINMVHDQNEPSSGKFRETSFFPPEITINHKSESKYALPHFDHQTSSMYPSVFVARKIDPLQNLYPSLSPGTFSEVYNNESFSEPFTNAYQSRLFTLELPTPTAAHPEVCPNIIPSAMQLKNNQNLSHSPISAMRFPFLHPDLDEQGISSWSRRSVKRPPLCFDVLEKDSMLSNSQSCSPGHNYPYLKPGSSHETDSSLPLEPDDFRIFFPMSSVSASQTSVAPSSLAPMPYYPGILMQKRHENKKKFKERRIGSRGLDHAGKKSKSQLSALSTVPFKPFKMPTVGSHGNIQCAIRKPTAHVGFDDSVENIDDAFETCPATNKPRLVMRGEYDQDERTGSPWVDSLIDPARTRPVKLSGGAKHILKACQHKDQSCSRSTDLEISLSATNVADFRFSESENSERIYRKTPAFEL